MGQKLEKVAQVTEPALGCTRTVEPLPPASSHARGSHARGSLWGQPLSQGFTARVYMSLFPVYLQKPSRGSRPDQEAQCTQALSLVPEASKASAWSLKGLSQEPQACSLAETIQSPWDFNQGHHQAFAQQLEDTNYSRKRLITNK